MAKGRIVVIEGTDRAGKTTQSRMLLDAIKVSGKMAAVVDFPDYTTPIGVEIKAFLDGKREYPNEVKHLLFSANRWEKKKNIESMLENGKILVMNRYYQSNLVYGVSNGLDESWLLKLDRGLPKEHLVIVILVHPGVSGRRATAAAAPLNRHSSSNVNYAERKSIDTFESDEELGERVFKNYRKYAKRFGWKVIDGEKGRERVHQEILSIVKETLNV